MAPEGVIRPAVTTGEPTLKWVCGVTTVQRRRRDLLPRTLTCLCAAGFPPPRLFLDGADHAAAMSYESEFRLPVTSHFPALRTYGNWLMALAELYLREPVADRYAVFQDDVLVLPDLRHYLDRTPYLPRTYWNLYTFPENQALCPMLPTQGPNSTVLGYEHVGFYPSNQRGKGAIGLVFDHRTVLTLLTSQEPKRIAPSSQEVTGAANTYLIERPLDAHRGYRAVDGAVVEALKKAGWTEMVHNPSLTQHIGDVSVMGSPKQPRAKSFPGEDYSALGLLQYRRAGK
jgi:hypothetical protein